MQDQVPETTATIIMSGNNPVVNMPPGLSGPPNYTSPTDGSVKNLEAEQKTLPPQNIGTSSKIQTASQVNFSGVVTSTSAGVNINAGAAVGAGIGTSAGAGFGAGGYTPISPIAHMFSNQPAVSFTSGK